MEQYYTHYTLWEKFFWFNSKTTWTTFLLTDNSRNSSPSWFFPKKFWKIISLLKFLVFFLLELLLFQLIQLAYDCIINDLWILDLVVFFVFLHQPPSRRKFTYLQREFLVDFFHWLFWHNIEAKFLQNWSASIPGKQFSEDLSFSWSRK